MPTISLATKDLPLPGPPAKKIALKMPGSFTPSFTTLFALSITSLNFILGTELVVQNNTYDFILTPFVLDVFPSDELGQMVNRVKKLLSNDGVWCCVDFNSRDRSFKARVLSFSMILFFRMVSGLKTSKVLDYFGSIKYAGMIEVNSTFFYGKFIRASLFKRK